MPDVTERLEDLDGQPVFWQEADGDDPPVLYVHGVPSCSDDFLPFLARTGGIAPDLPGFGRSSKRGDGDYTMEGYDHWLERFLDSRGIDRFRLVVHDWGAVGLLLAQRFPERVERLVVVNAVTFLPGYKWHLIARGWRTPLWGEMTMGLTNHFTVRNQLRLTHGTVVPPPEAFVDNIVKYMDQGTQRAILRLYRSSPPAKLAAAGARLGEITCPALVVWGVEDRYVRARFADGYKAALGDAEVLRVEGASHWPWIDKPELVETIAAFLDG
jgi:pimeloyl-ACP methyl ester carboxylesterase